MARLSLLLWCCFYCFQLASFPQYGGVVVVVSAQPTNPPQAASPPVPPPPPTVIERPPQPFTPQQQQQLLKLEQAIASSPDPQQTLQQVAQANQMSVDDVMQMLQQNRLQLQQQPNGAGAGGRFLFPTMAKKAVGMVMVVVTQLLSGVWRVWTQHPTRSSIIMLVTVLTLYITLVERPYNGWILPTSPSPPPILRWSRTSSFLTKHQQYRQQQRQQRPITSFWIPPTTFVTTKQQQHDVWSNKYEAWWSLDRDDDDDEDENVDDDDADLRSSTLLPWSIPRRWLKSLQERLDEAESTDDNDRVVLVPCQSAKDYQNDDIDDEEEKEGSDDDDNVPFQSLAVIQKTITMEDIGQGSMHYNNDDNNDNDEMVGLLNSMYQTAAKSMNAPLRWTLGTIESPSSQQFAFQLLSEPMQELEDDDERNDDYDDIGSTRRQQRQQGQRQRHEQQEATIQRALMLLPDYGNWNRCALQPFWMIPNIMDDPEEIDEDDREDNDKDEMLFANESRVTFVTCPQHGHWDGQVQCVIRANPRTGHLQLRLHVLHAKPTSSATADDRARNIGIRKQKRIETMTAVMAARWMEAWYKSLLPVLRQQYVRQKQSRQFASRYHQRAIKRRLLRQHVAEQLEDMAVERRRKWQRNNPNAGHYRPTGPRVPHFSGSTSAVTTI